MRLEGMQSDYSRSKFNQGDQIWHEEGGGNVMMRCEFERTSIVLKLGENAFLEGEKGEPINKNMIKCMFDQIQIN